MLSKTILNVLCNVSDVSKVDIAIATKQTPLPHSSRTKLTNGEKTVAAASGRRKYGSNNYVSHVLCLNQIL